MINLGLVSIEFVYDGEVNRTIGDMSLIKNRFESESLFLDDLVFTGDESKRGEMLTNIKCKVVKLPLDMDKVPKWFEDKEGCFGLKDIQKALDRLKKDSSYSISR